MTSQAPQEKSLEEQLAEVKAQRAAQDKQREDVRREAKLRAELAKQKRMLEEDAVFADMQDKYGVEGVCRINTPRGMVVVKAPDATLYREFNDKFQRADHPNPKVRTSFYDCCERLARFCVVYPSREEFDELTEKVSTLVTVACTQAIELGRASAEEDAGK